MDTNTIARLLDPFLPEAGPRPELLAAVHAYMELLLHWNQRLNLTAVRDAENIVKRHFGESFFAAAHWLGDGATDAQRRPATLIDVGSGAGFPGLPLKLYAPAVQLTLVEAHGKKATFLREVIRMLRLTGVTVLNLRAEMLVEQRPAPTADLVTLRAVEEFDRVLPIAGRLVSAGGRLGLLIGSAQVSRAAQLLPNYSWADPLSIPQSDGRVLVSGTR